MTEEQDESEGAIVYGDLDDALLDRQIEVGVSPAGSKTQPGRWRKMSCSVRDLLNKLAIHEEGDKDGPCFLGGSVIDGERKAMAIPHMDLLVLDLDTGEDIDTIRARIQALGLFAVIYTTHSHMKPITDVKKDAVVKWLGESDVNPDVEQVKAYLTDVKRYQPAVLEGAVLLETKQTAEGVKLFVQHQPMPKFRVVLLLKQRFVFMDRPGTQQDAIKEWKERYAGASKLLGAFFDRSCVDPSRLFYLPRHPKGAKEYRVEVIAGKPLDLDGVERVTAQELRLGSSGAFEQALGVASNARDYKTDGMLWFFKKYADLFDVETFLLDVDGDGDRGPRGSGAGRTHRCPNDDQHSNAGDDQDKGFFCVNATESESDTATARCSHDSCSQLDRIDFVDLICDKVGITVASELMKWVAETVDEEPAPSEKEAQTSDSADGEKTGEAYSNTVQAKRAIDDTKADKLQVAVNIGMSGFAPAALVTLKDLWLKGKHGHGAGVWNSLIKQGQDAVKKETRDVGGFEKDAITELGKMNKKHAVVMLGSKVRVMVEHGKGVPPTFIEKDGFITFNAHRKIEMKNDEGEVRMAPLTKAWFEWPDTHRYEKVVFEPNGCPADWCNLWRGFPVEPKKGDWSMLRTHVFENICLGNAENYDWLMTWLAQIFQFPGDKKGSAVVVRGRKGSGKSRLFDFVRMAMGDTALKVSHRDHITNQFNAHQQGLVLMVAEEAFWAGDTSAGGILKDLITSNEMLMTPKGIDSQKVSNYMRLAMVSNEDWVVPAGFEDERRFFVLQCGEARRGKQHTQFWADLTYQMEHKGGLQAMMFDLMAWKPTMFEEGWDALRHPPATPWLTDQAKESMTIWEKFFLKLVTDGEMQVINRPDGMTVKDLILFDDLENIISKKDLEYFYDSFILKSNSGKHKFGDSGLTRKLVEDWLLASPQLIRSTCPNGYEPNSPRETCYKLPPLSIIRQDLVERKHIHFEEILDEVDETGVKAA